MSALGVNLTRIGEEDEGKTALENAYKAIRSTYGP